MIPLIKTRFDRLVLPLGLLGMATVAGYNFWLWRRDKLFLAQRSEPDRSLPLEEWPDLPKVSVLVAAWNEAQNIDRHIQSFLSLRYPNKELLLCAGGEDDTFDLATSYCGSQVKVFKQQAGEGKQRSLARVFPHSDGSIIFLTDADCVLNNFSFERTIAPIAQGRETATTGRFSPLLEQRENSFVQQQWYVDTYWRERSPDYIEGLIGRNSAVARDALENTGGFSASVMTGTDYYLARQLTSAGTKIRYVHESRVDTVFQTEIKKYLRQQSRWLRNIFLHGPAFGEWQLALRAIFQCLSGYIILIWPVSFSVIGWAGISSWLVLLLHGSLSRLRRIRYAELALARDGNVKTYVLAPVFFIIDQIMLAYTLLESILPGLRWRW